MSGDSGWTGHRLGPYQIGERYPEVPEDEGTLYEAHHTGTGEPALVVMPGPGDTWPPGTPWRTETTRFSEPDALVVHPRPLAGATLPTLHELTLGFIRIAGALAQLDTREDLRNPFTRQPRRIGSWTHARRWRLVGAGLALTAVVAVLLWHGDSSLPQRDGPSAESILFANGNKIIPPGIAYKMPEKPFKEQSKAPCLAEAEVEIRGGCWNELARTSPCARGTAEYQGKCYIPVRKPDPEPTSVQP